MKKRKMKFSCLDLDKHDLRVAGLSERLLKALFNFMLIAEQARIGR